MRILRTFARSRAVWLVSTLAILCALPAATTDKPFLTPFIVDISPANCSAATSHIVGSGIGINVVRETISAGGSVHAGYTFNNRGQATDENGVVWTIDDADSQTFNSFVGSASEVTTVENIHLISHGPIANIVLHSVVKVKFAADGSTTLEFMKEHGNGEDCPLRNV
jgi:hypothetical protein